MGNWADFMNECREASKWLASATEKTENVISAFERGEISKFNLERHLDGVSGKLFDIEWGIISTWERELDKEILPRIIPHWCFFGFFDNKPKTLGYCHIGADDFREIFLSKNIMIAGNGQLVMNVLAHELLHAILERNAGHRWKFIKGMTILNYYLGLNIRTRESGFTELNKFKYVVFCPHCHKAIRYFQRRGEMVKHPENYYHRACHTELQSKPYTDKYVTF